MNNIEFKALAKGLGLSQRQIQEIGGYKDPRQIRRFYAGDQPPHRDVVEALKQIDIEIDDMVAKTVSMALALGVGVDNVNVVGYTDKQYRKHVTNGLLFSDLHLCMLFRLSKELKKINVKCNIIPFNYERFLDFIKDKNLEDSNTTRTMWADFEFNLLD